MDRPVSTSIKTRLIAASALLGCLAFSPAAYSDTDQPAAAAQAAQTPDVAVGTIEAFDNALIDTMKNAKELGIDGRYKKLAPVIDNTYNLGLMTRIASGSYWPRLSADQQKKLIDAFRNLTIATYAANFDGYSGQKFTINPDVITRRGDRIVRTQLVEDNKKPIDIAYRLHETGGQWRVIDVFYSGSISQLSVRRSEFTSALSSGTAEALAKKLNTVAANLMAAGRKKP